MQVQRFAVVSEQAKPVCLLIGARAPRDGKGGFGLVGRGFVFRCQLLAGELAVLQLDGFQALEHGGLKARRLVGLEHRTDPRFFPRPRVAHQVGVDDELVAWGVLGVALDRGEGDEVAGEVQAQRLVSVRDVSFL